MVLSREWFQGVVGNSMHGRWHPQFLAQTMTLFYAGAYETAVPIFERIIEVNAEDPLYFLFHEGLAEAQYGLGNYTAAFDAARRSLALKGGMIPAELLLTASSAHLGLRDVAYDTIRATTGRPRDLAGRVFGHIRDRASYFRQIRDDLHQADIPL